MRHLWIYCTVTLLLLLLSLVNFVFLRNAEDSHALFDGTTLARSLGEQGFVYSLFVSVGACVPMLLHVCLQLVGFLLAHEDAVPAGGGRWCCNYDNHPIQNLIPQFVLILLLILSLLLPSVAMISVLLTGKEYVAYYLAYLSWQQSVFTIVSFGFLELSLPECFVFRQNLFISCALFTTGFSLKNSVIHNYPPVTNKQVFLYIALVLLTGIIMWVWHLVVFIRLLLVPPDGVCPLSAKSICICIITNMSLAIFSSYRFATFTSLQSIQNVRSDTVTNTTVVQLTLTIVLAYAYFVIPVRLTDVSVSRLKSNVREMVGALNV